MPIVSHALLFHGRNNPPPKTSTNEAYSNAYSKARAHFELALEQNQEKAFEDNYFRKDYTTQLKAPSPLRFVFNNEQEEKYALAPFPAVQPTTPHEYSAMHEKKLDVLIENIDRDQAAFELTTKYVLPKYERYMVLNMLPSFREAANQTASDQMNLPDITYSANDPLSTPLTNRQLATPLSPENKRNLINISWRLVEHIVRHAWHERDNLMRNFTEQSTYLNNEELLSTQIIEIADYIAIYRMMTSAKIKQPPAEATKKA